MPKPIPALPEPWAAINTATHDARKNTQRARLLNGMVAAANRGGHAGANVTAVIAEAGVSRSTFYDYFADRDDCFVKALAQTQGKLLDQVRWHLSAQAYHDPMCAAVAAIVEFARTESAMSRFLMSEALAGGAGALDTRDAGIEEIEQAIEATYRELPATARVADVCPRIVIGGVCRLLGSRLRRGEPRISAVLDDLMGWLESYARPVGEQRRRKLKAGRRPARSAYLPERPMRAPPPLPPGRPRLSEQQVAANHRERILFAAAQLAEKNGYAATTIGEITKLARVDGRAFYGLFADKQDAFMTVHELGFQELMATTAAAFFAGATWPQRSWEAARAFTQFLEQSPTVARVGFVEAYAVGPGAIQRVEDSHTAFTIFLQEGYQHAQGRRHPSRLALEAIITTIFEVVYRQVRAGATAQLSTALAVLNYHWLAPFTGPGEADELIDKQLSAEAAAQINVIAGCGAVRDRMQRSLRRAPFFLGHRTKIGIEPQNQWATPQINTADVVYNPGLGGCPRCCHPSRSPRAPRALQT
jgi:AcrR family transcriptional regulator